MPQPIVVTVQQAAGVDWSAWVSAGAAVIQAVAAGLAIWYSGKLARESATREMQAEAAATRRAEQAEAAAAERTERADREATERAARAEKASFNEPLDALIKVGEAAIDALNAALADAQAMGANDRAWRALPAEVKRIAEVAPALRERTRSPEAMVAATEMAQAAGDLYLPMGANGAELVAIFSARSQALESALTTLRTARHS